MERILTPVGWNLLFAGVLAIFAWGGGRWSVLRRRPKFLYGMWLLVLVKLVAPPLVALPILQPEVIPEIAPVEWSPAPVVVPVMLEQLPMVVVPAEAPQQFQLTVYFREPRFRLFVIVVTSLAVTLTLWGRTYFQVRRWQRLLDQVPQAEERFKKLAETATERMGLKRVPEVRLVEGELTPFLWTGRQKFLIVFPVSLAEKLTDEQVLCILMHELAHYRRRDHWGHAFAGIVTSLFWWNPVSWWAWRELRGYQEICCDALVLQVSEESRRLYAETLFKVLETLQTGKSVQPSLSCGFGDSQHLRRRFIMLADTKLTPRLSPMTVCALLGIAALIPCLPTRAEPVKDSRGNQGVIEAEGVAGDPNQAQSSRFTFRMSVHTKDKSQGHGKVVDGPPGSDTKVTFDGSTQTVPAITVEGSQIASVGMILPSIGGKLEEDDKSVPRLSLTAKPTATADGKIILDLNLKLEPEERFAETFVPPESPFVIEDNKPRKIVLFGPQDDPVQWVEITVTKVKPQELYQLHGAFHLESLSAGEVQHSSQDFNIITLRGVSATILLDQLKLAEVDPEISIPSFTLTLNPGDETDIPVSFTGELSVVSRKDFRSRVLSRKRAQPYPLKPGKSERYIIEEREGKPTFWLEMIAERIPGRIPVSHGVLPPALAPHPQLYLQGFVLPERFWINPGEPVAAMRSPTRAEFQPIIDHITRNIAPKSWAEKGGHAQYELLLMEHKLFVFSTAEVHKQIGDYLKSIWHSPTGRTEEQALSTSDSSAVPGEPGYTPPRLGHSTIVAHDFVIPTGKDPLGRPIATRKDYEKFIATLKEFEPKSWESNGGKGKIEYSQLTGMIYFQNNPEVSSQIHKKCSELLSNKDHSVQPLPALPANAVIKPVSNERSAIRPPAIPIPSPAPAPLDSPKPESQEKQSKLEERSPNPFYVVIYNVDKLFELDKGRDLKQQPLVPTDLQTLADQLAKLIAPNSWTSNGGQGVIKPVISEMHGPCLVIRQIDEIHEQFNIHIDKLRRERGIDTSRGFSHYPTNPASPDPNKMVTAGFALPNVVLECTINEDGRPIVDQAQLDKLLADLRQIDPQAWKPLGGPCSMTVSADRCTLSVTATPEVFGMVNRHLRKLYHSLSPSDLQHYNGPLEALKQPIAHALPAPPVIKPVSNEVPENRQGESSKLYVETYAVSDLIEISKDRNLTVHPLTPKDLEALAEEIQKEVVPSAWGKSGGDGMVEPVEYVNNEGQKTCGLVIRQTQTVHLKVQYFLKEKRRLKAEQQQVPKQ